MIHEATPPQLIDVRKLMHEVSLEDLCRTADEFFRAVDWNTIQAKPFADIAETPELLICFAHVVRGLNLLPDMTVLDFGAGACWTSRFLSQLGMKVIALDVSNSALEIGRDLYRKVPVLGNRPKPQFLLFDGLRIELPDNSVDRVTCWDAFHHVPNPQQVINEIARVLKDGGIAGFSEPGPQHSKTEQSQYEMRTNRVIENDVDVHEIWNAASTAGFTDIRLAVFNAEPALMSLADFDSYLSGEANSGQTYLSAVREQMQPRRLFFLYKGDRHELTDSRQRVGLRGELNVQTSSPRVRQGESLQLKVIVENTGHAVWLPTPEQPRPWWQRGVLSRVGRRPHMGPDRVPPRIGGVRLGLQLLNSDGELLDIDYFRYHLTPNDGREIHPGEKVEFSVAVPMLRKGAYILQCDLVSEHVCWFERTGAAPRRLTVEVI
jgi:SAM-dependent methyltransferase